MAKPTLFFTLRRKWHVGGFEVIRVTTAAEMAAMPAETDTATVRM